MWMRLAAQLNASVVEAKQRVSSIEFIDWLVYFEEVDNERSSLEYYLAQIALEIRHTNTKRRYKIKNFLLDFEKVIVKSVKDLSPEEYEAEKKRLTEEAKSYWVNVLSIKKKQNVNNNH